MKILTGSYRGRNFYMPADIRPTQNVARKAIFDLIGHDLSGLTVLDLYAGSGAVGLEALSLGASKVTFVEKAPKCVDVIAENLTLLGLKDGHYFDNRCELLQADALAAIKAFSGKKRAFHLVFLDPPYDRGLVKKTLKTLGAYDIVHPVSFIIVQYGKSEYLPETQEGFSLIKRQRYGKSFLAIFQKK
ncbi:MAG TPA: 16S rRNA (guanine(966)-N(2))-methyltransferase RsmD [Candidatus Omnitrophota bacterium]|nr:16S rRNA (guanine(966)-N(2))-methyltransferase RsmD [Candidatus Omnitrophota bacterium]HQO58946.1 16S rRNA (guanine(966)-N(2))-methyltransferase RsmD [Candidatus Omnitrophota bacterium]HQP11976.1 16S rRNA (guanine(966)-N(2))-methyltransferase RsmD [Candidatus Omnitrophota bacterium]